MSNGLSNETDKLALKYSLDYRGKIEVVPKVPIRNLNDFSIWYTPGVAAVSEAIKKDRELSFDYTYRWNSIAIVTDGSRVLGLGNIGPEAAMPVMEGKALIYKYLGGVDAVPLPINAKDPEKMIETIKTLEPAFGGINLEDVASPKCFYVMDRLKAELEIPIWHDDQQGTAGVILAGLINSLKLTERKLHGTKIVFFGLGAANIATAKILIEAGADPGNFILIDSKGIVYRGREDMDELVNTHPWKHDLAVMTNREDISGDVREAFENMDVLIAASKPGPNIVQKEWIEKMNERSIVFLLANPVPEIWPWEAKDAGAEIIATGRSDFPNQVNNSLLFPAIFRGTLDIRSRAITDEIIIAGAEELARCARDTNLHKEHIIPTMEEWEVYPKVAAKVGERAVELGLARKSLSKNEIYEEAKKTISRSRRLLNVLVDNRLIKNL